MTAGSWTPPGGVLPWACLLRGLVKLYVGLCVCGVCLCVCVCVCVCVTYPMTQQPTCKQHSDYIWYSGYLLEPDATFYYIMSYILTTWNSAFSSPNQQAGLEPRWPLGDWGLKRETKRCQSHSTASDLTRVVVHWMQDGESHTEWWSSCIFEIR